MPDAIDDFSIKAVLFGLASDHRIQRPDRLAQVRRQRETIDVERQAHAAVDAHLPNARGLEAELDQPWRHHGDEFGGMVIGGQFVGHQADDLLAVPPGFFTTW